MKILTKHEEQLPIYRVPGDTFQLTYIDEFGIISKKLSYSITKNMTINYWAIAELDKKELKKLGLKDAIVGIFGEK